MFIEGDLAIVIAHVNLKLPGGPPALPSVVGVAEPKIFLGRSEARSTPGPELDLEETEEQSSEVGDIGHSAFRRFKDRHDHKESPDSDEVFSLET